jgi:beta-N-acetylhexosaminidase
MLGLIQSGVIPESRLDESVRRILNAKARFGLLDWKPDAAPYPVSESLGTEEHRAIANDIARNSITLVKNDKHTLPIQSDQSVALLWPAGINSPEETLRKIHPQLEVLFYELDPTGEEIQRLVERAQAHSTVVLGTFRTGQHPGQAEFVQSLISETDSLIVVGLDSPYDLLYFSEAPVYLVTYGTVPASLQAMGEVLFGTVKPGGRLPVRLPGLFPVGHGMTDY